MSPNDLIFADLKKSNQVSDEVIEVYRAHMFAKEFYQRHLRRCVENWRFYVSLDADLGFGQWSPEAVAYMLNQGRQILTYNICTPIIDRIAGGMMSLPIDPDFIPVNSEMTGLTKAVKSAMYSDKEIMDWPGVTLQMAKGGLIFDACMKMVISDEFHKLGNIGFEYCHPGTVIPDPMWRTWRGKDAEVCYHEQFFQPDKMLELWPEAEALIGPYLQSVKRGGNQYGSQMGPTPFATVNSDSWGTAQRVISQYRMVNSKYLQEYAMTQSGDVPIPRFLRTPAEKINWLNNNVPDWAPDHIYEVKETERKCVVTRICPTISYANVIENNLPEVQVGRLPFFFWSASRDNGEPHSIIDSIKDAQTNINYWESMITNKIQIEGGGGSQFVDRLGFKDDEEFDKYRALRNNPAETFEVKPGSMANGYIPAKPTQASEFPKEAYEHLNHLIGTMLPWISKVTPASRGTTETDVKSGYLYKLMTIQSEQQLYTIHYGWRVFWNEVYEAYLIQASQTYANELIPRTFTYNKGQESVTLNEPVSYSDGRQGIKNDASKLKYIRHKVIISEKQSSPSQRVEDLKVLGEYLPTIPAEMPGSRMFLVKKSQELIDMLDEGDKQVLSSIGDKELELAMANIEANTLKAKVDSANFELQLANLQIQSMQVKAKVEAIKNNPQALLPNQNQTTNQPPPQDAAGESIPINEPQAQGQGVIA